MIERDLETTTAAEATGPSQRRLWELLLGSREDALEYAVVIQQDLLRFLEDSSETESHELDLVRAQLALLLAERGAAEDALLWAEEVAGIQGFSQGMHFLYGEAGSPSPGLEDFLRSGAAGWAGERAIIRTARRRGEPELADDLEAELLARDRSRFRSEAQLLAANGSLVLLGLGALGFGALRRWRRESGEASASAVAPWTLGQGVGVLVRGDFWSQLYFAGLARLPESVALSAIGTSLYGCGTLFASLPLVWLVHRHLLSPSRELRADPLGLNPLRAGMAGLLAITMAGLAIDLIGTYGISWATWELGIHPHWSEAFDETLIWGEGIDALLLSVDYVAWAPLFEELAFRGVLYLSLRRHLGPLPAALVSGGIFSALHFYSLAGFLATLWSGVVWAWVFERSGSLLPAVAAHAVYNGLFVAGLVLVYR
jgi:membrane protease YdiL (CAAX protease family)